MPNINLSNLIILKVKSANKIYAKTNTKTLRKNRERWGVAIKTKGYTEYVCNGKKYISDEHHITILPKGSSYLWESFGGECLMIDFDANFESSQIYSYSINEFSKIVSLFNKLEKNRAQNGLEVKNLKYLYEIFTIILEHNKKEYFPTTKTNIILPAVEYITKNFHSTDFNCETLSNLCGISTVYFRKLFTDIYKIPPIEYVHKLRMNKACEILKSDYNSIESVAFSVGYNSVYHFSKMFKTYFGASPSEYAKASRK